MLSLTCGGCIWWIRWMHLVDSSEETARHPYAITASSEAQLPISRRFQPLALNAFMRCNGTSSLIQARFPYKLLTNQKGFPIKTLCIKNLYRLTSYFTPVVLFLRITRALSPIKYNSISFLSKTILLTIGRIDRFSFQVSVTMP